MGWLRKKDPVLPVTEEQRKSIDMRWQWIVEMFGESMLCNREVLTPDVRSFPVTYDNTRTSAVDTLAIIARNMDLDPAEINLELYQESGNEISSMFLETHGRTGGLYWGRDEEDGLFHIGLECKYLSDPEGMVAVLSHELAHVKLLGKELLEENDEPLTDLTTIAFGLGVFNANACFRFHKSKGSWGYNKLGYLSQMEWGYALAKYAVMRGALNPSWIEYLTPNVKSDLLNSAYFL